MLLLEQISRILSKYLVSYSLTTKTTACVRGSLVKAIPGVAKIGIPTARVTNEIFRFNSSYPLMEGAIKWYVLIYLMGGRVGKIFGKGSWRGP